MLPLKLIFFVSRICKILKKLYLDSVSFDAIIINFKNENIKSKSIHSNENR